MQEGHHHITCVCPTTGARRAFLPWAIRWFSAQRQVDADLLIVDDTGDPVSSLVPSDERMSYERVDGPGLPLGEKYNHCVKSARGPWIALWADDDWHAPWKLSRLLDAVLAKPSALVAGQRSMLFHRVGYARSWVYDRPGDPGDPYLLGGSLLFHRDYWTSVRKFDETATRAADAHFTNSLSRDEYAELVAVLPRNAALSQYVATIHPGNTGRAAGDPAGPGWKPWPESFVAELMGSAYGVWQPGGAICDALGLPPPGLAASPQNS